MAEAPGGRSKFRIGLTAEPRPSDPESLFRDLKSRSPDVPYLWSHQADLLRAYAKEHQDTTDIALELPTGAGKTLIGLLLAEYRRRKHDERVVYLCPTRQLAHQAFEHGKEYGLRPYLVLRPGYANLNDYRQGRGIAVTTYSAVFNTNPRIADAEVIVLDDAHAAEDYIAGPWSVTIGRRTHKALYEEVIHLVGGDLTPWFRDNLLDDAGRDSAAVTDVDMLPGPALYRHGHALRGLLDAHLQESTDGERFPWSKVRGTLHACNLFVSWHELLLRPIIPPTQTHAAFAGARQRIYMSATLGEGGELERIAGIRGIDRLPMPEGWDRQSAGRRLFLFPDLTTDRQDALPVELAALRHTDRALVLLPRRVEISNAAQRLADEGVQVLSDADVEESLEPFTSRTNVALLLARYDGIDLPGDDCRLLIVDGLPVGTNLHERFLFHRLGVTAPYRDRLRTRFTQGAGRCCRNSTDYAAVLAVGQDVLDFCARRENRSGLHPELQAEVEFGLDNSRDVDAATLLDYLQVFYKQEDDWEEAEADIIRRRADKVKAVDPVAVTLKRVVADEVDYAYALWRQDYGSALDKAIRVADQLGSDETRGYQAWWYYVAGSVAWLDGVERDGDAGTGKAAELFHRAAQRASVSWFSELARRTALGEGDGRGAEASAGIENVAQRLKRLGFYGPRFERAMAELLNDIGQTDSTRFELGLERLGGLLGFDASRSATGGAPDGVWMLSDKLAVAFEAKSDESPGDAVSLTTVRQANTHPIWVRNNRRVASDADIFTVVVTPRSTIDEGAKQAIDNLFYLHVDDARAVAGKLVAALRQIRSQAVQGDSDQLHLVETIKHELGAVDLLPENVLTCLRKTPLDSLPAPKVKEAMA